MASGIKTNVVNILGQPYKFKECYTPVYYNRMRNYIKEKLAHSCYFTHQPSTDVLIDLLDKLALINKCVQRPDWPIRKHNFYNIKSNIINWLMYQLGNPEISWKITEIQRPLVNAADLCVIRITVAGHEYEFHQPLENDFQWLVAEDIQGMEYKPFYRNVTVPDITRAEIINTWKEILNIMAANSWFVYDDMKIIDWYQTIQKRYPACKFKVPERYMRKLDVILAGGPVIEVNGREICQLGRFKNNFVPIMQNMDMLFNFDLGLK